MAAFATSSDGLQIAYDVLGWGLPALVFVHGWSCHRKYWDAQLSHFSSTALVVAVDLPGHGESGVCRHTWSIDAFGSDVAAVVNDLALEDMVLIGHSMGADVALEAARMLEGRVRGLIWIDQYRQLSQFMDHAQVQHRMAGFRSAFQTTAKTFVRDLFAESTEPQLIERVATDISSAPPHLALPILEATWNHGRKVPALLAALEIPIATINSLRAPTDIESMRSRGVEVVLMPGVGHFPMLERPQEFNTCLDLLVASFPEPSVRDA